MGQRRRSGFHSYDYALLYWVLSNLTEDWKCSRAIVGAVHLSYVFHALDLQCHLLQSVLALHVSATFAFNSLLTCPYYECF